ncbi:MAG TPA: S41 family peptidase [Anaerolineales bacterium]|nr:S41 family peptidase [Anaerolineales bacterium]
MKVKRLTFGLLILSMLACNYVTQMILPPTATPIPTLTLTSTSSPTPTQEPLKPAFIPPECAAGPLATISPEIASQLAPEFDPVEISQGEQMRILRGVASIVQDVYVYPDFNGKDWSEIESRYSAKVQSGLDTESFYGEMQAMITELGDEHSAFISPIDVEEADAELRGELTFVSVGIYGQPDFARGRMVVISTYPGSPAEYGGIQHHDSILLVDGLPITEETSNRLRGPECSAVILNVQSPGEAPRDVMLLRTPIEGNIPIDARLVLTKDGSRVGYIFIPSFFDESLPPQIENALNEFGQLDGLILDVRMNGGGSSSVAYPILEYFIEGRLGEFVSRTDSRDLIIDPNPVQNSLTVPLVVMVSEDTVSFGEIFAGVLKDSGRAKIVGETSLGNVEVLRGYNFEDGSQLWIASETFYSAFSNANWEETGIVPDVQAFADWDTFYFDTDPSIAAALQVLGHQ